MEFLVPLLGFQLVLKQDIQYLFVNRTNTKNPRNFYSIYLQMDLYMCTFFNVPRYKYHICYIKATFMKQRRQTLPYSGSYQLTRHKYKDKKFVVETPATWPHGKPLSNANSSSSHPINAPTKPLLGSSCAMCSRQAMFQTGSDGAMCPGAPTSATAPQEDYYVLLFCLPQWGLCVTRILGPGTPSSAVGFKHNTCLGALGRVCSEGLQMCHVHQPPTPWLVNKLESEIF